MLAQDLRDNMKKSFSKRNFVYCASSETEVPIEQDEQCCDFYNQATHKCEYKKYSHRPNSKRLSEREINYLAFSSRDNEDLEN